MPEDPQAEGILIMKVLLQISELMDKGMESEGYSVLWRVRRHLSSRAVVLSASARDTQEELVAAFDALKDTISEYARDALKDTISEYARDVPVKLLASWLVKDRDEPWNHVSRIPPDAVISVDGQAVQRVWWIDGGQGLVQSYDVFGDGQLYFASGTPQPWPDGAEEVSGLLSKKMRGRIEIRRAGGDLWWPQPERNLP